MEPTVTEIIAFTVYLLLFIFGVQAQAILDMRLKRLTGLEKSKIEEEIAELQRLVKELEEILASEEKILGVKKFT